MSNLDTRVPTPGPMGHAIDVSFREALAASKTDSLATIGARAQPAASNGMPAMALTIAHATHADGSVITASAGSGNFGVSMTLGTSLYLAGETAEGSTSTDTAVWEVVLPDCYVAGTNVTVTVNAKYTGTGTAGTKTIQALAYLVAAAGTMGADLIGATPLAITNANANYTFTIPGATLTPGARLLISAIAVLQETGGVATLTAQINSITLS